MCGIFSILNNDKIDKEIIDCSFVKGMSRGPEYSSYMELDNIDLGFHRLAINGLNKESNQPLFIENIVLVCNGEIYNYPYLKSQLNNTSLSSTSDCEIIIHLYIKYGIEFTLSILDGEYAFILLDKRESDKHLEKLYVCRDPFGIRPLYQFFTHKDNIFGFASEAKSLVPIHHFYIDTYNQTALIEQFAPGTVSYFEKDKNHLSVPQWHFIHSSKYYNMRPVSYHQGLDMKYDINHNYYISNYLYNAVKKRVLNTERPVACLLSGGLDSSLVAALANKCLQNINQLNYRLKTFSIGLENSEDLKYAKLMATYLNSDHTEVIITENEMFEAIPEVIYAIESYDTTTIRASIGNYLIGKYIANNTDCKVILNGDGSDELFGGYIYFNKCPNDLEFEKEIRHLLTDIYQYDVLRSDKCISSHGLEPRTPFLDLHLVEYYLSINIYHRNQNNHNQCEKYLLRNAFKRENYLDHLGRQLLPNEILWRQKEAFSDGVSSHKKSLFEIIQEKIRYEKNELYSNDLSGIELEKKYYKEVFSKLFKNCDNLTKYYWMPKYTATNDPSARTIEFYNETKTPLNDFNKQLTYNQIEPITHSNGYSEESSEDNIDNNDEIINEQNQFILLKLPNNDK